MQYTTIIGLEVHVQLLTESKLFCSCSTRFGAPPNTQTCPVCLGMPGVLPVMNRRAFELSLKTALALNCRIAPFTKWDRKNYYYPDLPKNYQISQYDLPFSSEGYLEIHSPEADGETRRIGIIRVHLEEDAGKLLHCVSGGESRVDLNRTGTPLLEIVSKPDLRSPAEAKEYLTELKLLLTYLGVSDCNMQEGSLRVDANVNLHIHHGADPIATPIVEVKNMNSFRAVERALAYEQKRQLDEWQSTGHRLGDAPKQTRGWDDDRGATLAQRSKEEASDYRYFPEPDLVPVKVDSSWIDQARSTLGELPADRRRRFETEYALPAYDADVLVSQGAALADYFEQVAGTSGDAKRASNWVQQDILRTLNDRKITIGDFPVSADATGELLRKVTAQELNTNLARDVFGEMIDSGKSAAEIIAARGLEPISDSAELATVIDRVLAANAKAVADFRSGKQAAAGPLIGQVMKETRGQANAAVVRQLLMEKLNAAQ
jgi:aspartyl-tRNA(Asn)/glutamyl-tRNA(Gln) amidotransferase subunit B